jgi:carboxyl-terminal processing protease
MIKKFTLSVLFTVLTLSSGFQSKAQSFPCIDLPVLISGYYLREHVTIRKLSDELKQRSVEQYIKIIDPTKTILIQSDVDKIKKDLMGLWDTMRLGNCQALQSTQNTLLARAVEVEEFVRGFVVPQYKIDEKAEFMLDPEKRNFAKTLQERNETLQKFIHFQMANYILTDTKPADARRQLVHRYEVATKRIRERGTEQLHTQFIDAFTAGLDPHSSFFSRDRLEDFEIDMRLSLDGIGASLSSQDGYTVVEEIIVGGAADRSKLLKPKDKIMAVAQEKDGKRQEFQSVIDMELREVVKLIRGKKGTRVHLQILRQTDKPQKIDVSIVRDKVNLADAAAKIRYETRKVDGQDRKIGILELPSFYGDGTPGGRSSYADVKKLLGEAREAKVDGLVLNLARNGGGLLEDAIRISGLFLKEGPIVATKDANAKTEIREDGDDATLYAGPLVVLTTRGSASASEILAGALRDYNRALIVGADHTFGKGTVQAVKELPRKLGAVKVTTGVYFVPSGHSTQHTGVDSDIVLPNAMNNDEFGEKGLENSLPPMKIRPFLGREANAKDGPDRWNPLTPDLVNRLRAASQSRVTKDPKFLEIQKEISEAEKNKGMIRLSELLAKSKTDKEKNKKDEAKTVAERIRDREAPYVNEAVNIALDLVQSSPKSVTKL